MPRISILSFMMCEKHGIGKARWKRRLPGNLIIFTLWPSEYNRSHSFFTCVVFPARSSPSTTTNAPRWGFWAGSRYGYSSSKVFDMILCNAFVLYYRYSMIVKQKEGKICSWKRLQRVFHDLDAILGKLNVLADLVSLTTWTWLLATIRNFQPRTTKLTISTTRRSPHYMLQSTTPVTVDFPGRNRR